MEEKWAWVLRYLFLIVACMQASMPLQREAIVPLSFHYPFLLCLAIMSLLAWIIAWIEHYAKATIILWALSLIGVVLIGATILLFTFRGGAVSAHWLKMSVLSFMPSSLVYAFTKLWYAEKENRH